MTEDETRKFHGRILDVLEQVTLRLIALEQKVGLVQLPAGSVDGDNKSDPQYCP